MILLLLRNDSQLSVSDFSWNSSLTSLLLHTPGAEDAGSPYFAYLQPLNNAFSQFQTVSCITQEPSRQENELELAK